MRHKQQLICPRIKLSLIDALVHESLKVGVFPPLDRPILLAV